MDLVSRIPTFWVVISLLALTGVRAGLSIAERRENRDSDRARAWGEVLESFVIAVVIVFLVVRPFVAQAFYIPSRSMAPTLNVSDRIIVNKFAYRLGEPVRYDVVVFRAPKEASRGINEEEKDFVKRVIGLPGDVIEVHGGTTYINGKPDPLSCLPEPVHYDLPPTTVPEGKLFVLGDNRNHSNDSHAWGVLDRELIIGKAEFVFWPLARVGGIR